MTFSSRHVSLRLPTQDDVLIFNESGEKMRIGMLQSNYQCNHVMMAVMLFQHHVFSFKKSDAKEIAKHEIYQQPFLLSRACLRYLKQHW